MRTRLQDKIVKEAIYIAEDGTEFKDIKRCEEYEVAMEDLQTPHSHLLYLRSSEKGRQDNEPPQRLTRVVTSEIVERNICEIVYNDDRCMCPSCGSILFLGKKFKGNLRKKFFCMSCGARLVVIRRVIGRNIIDEIN